MQNHTNAATISELLVGLLRRAWRDLLSVYYANTPVWRVLKSVSLLFFGFFCWSASSLLLSYRPAWTFLRYGAAYGFALIFYGPLTHLIILPAVIRLRRTAQHPVAVRLAKRGSKLNLSVFVVIVLLLGTWPAGPMTLDFAAAFEDDPQPDVDADFTCTQVDDLIECEFEEASGFDHVVVLSGQSELRVVDDPPYRFELRTDELVEVVGQKEFIVELRDEDGDTLRRYRRTAKAA
ncbi:hypothetical protein ACNS7O_14760 (plasmid) [Haloferacaceae archaeon DSL9]